MTFLCLERIAFNGRITAGKSSSLSAITTAAVAYGVPLLINNRAVWRGAYCCDEYAPYKTSTGRIGCMACGETSHLGELVTQAFNTRYEDLESLFGDTDLDPLQASIAAAELKTDLENLWDNYFLYEVF